MKKFTTKYIRRPLSQFMARSEGSRRVGKQEIHVVTHDPQLGCHSNKTLPHLPLAKQIISQNHITNYHMQFALWHRPPPGRDARYEISLILCYSYYSEAHSSTPLQGALEWTLKKVAYHYTLTPIYKSQPMTRLCEHISSSLLVSLSISTHSDAP